MHAIFIFLLFIGAHANNNADLDKETNPCKGKEDGFYEVEDCSSKYLKCENEDHFYKECSNDMIFNGRLCVPELKRTCVPIRRYTMQLSNLSNYCITKTEFEEICGFTACHAPYFILANEVIGRAWDQMGINEMRRLFHLKQQNLRFGGLNSEKPETSEVSSQGLDHFQLITNTYTQFRMFPFLQEDVNRAERIMDQKFPEVRQLFRKEFENSNATPNNRPSSRNRKRNASPIKERYQRP